MNGKHGDDGDGQQDVEQEELRAGQLVLDRGLLGGLLQLHGALGLGELAVQAGAAALLLPAGESRVDQSQHDAEDLDGQDGLPELTGLNAENGGRAHGGAGPGHEVQNAHRQHRDAQQRGRAHVHALVDRQHGGDHDAEGGGAAAVEVADQRDDAGDERDAHDVVAHQLHQLADDDVEHAGVGHDAEVEHAEHEQGRGRTGGVEAGLDHGGDVVEAVAAAEHQDQREDRGPYDEGDGGLGLALEQGDDDGDDGQKTENADECVAHKILSFLIKY